MPYPSSPFSETINNLILEIYSNDHINQAEKIQNELYLKDLLRWLCTSPSLTSIRVNTISFTVEDIQKLIEKEIVKITGNSQIPKVAVHPDLHDLIIINNRALTDAHSLKMELNEVVVDVNCASAILRGAHIFAAGIIGMLNGTKVNDTVSVFADIEGKCKKGFHKIYQSSKKLFIANGIAKLNREQLFGSEPISTGIAVEITDRISHCLSINETLLPAGSILLQNIPSVVCVHALKVIPELTILDMCAAPGNKTTHISALMQNKQLTKRPPKWNDFRKPVRSLVRRCLFFKQIPLIL